MGRTGRFVGTSVALLSAAVLLAACNGGEKPPARPPAATGERIFWPSPTGIGANRAPSSSAPTAAASEGVIVRLKGPSAFEMHARERRHGLAAALAATKAQRTQLVTQHRRFVTTLATKLGPLPARRGRGIVLGRSVDDFIDIINGVALHGVDEATARTMLANNPDVASIEPIREVHATLTVSVPLIEADKVWAVADVNGIGIDGAGMRIGILDTGVDYTHPDLGGCLGAGCKVAAGYDFVNHDADPMDDHGHGTHVAATAAGDGSYIGASGPAPIRGVAPGAEIYAYKVLSASGSGWDDDIIAAVERCADPNGDGDPPDHLDVCSLSIGGGGDPDDASSTAVDNATAAGVVFSIAAGNSGPGASTINSPGTARRAITVAAACKPSSIGVDPGCELPIADFSSRGPVVWGAQTLAKPDVAAPGVSICAAALGSSGGNCLDGRHIALSGTSMATPHVAGVAALLRQAHPEWTPDQVKSFIMAGAHSFGLDPSVQGAGMVDAFDSLTLGGLPTQIARIGGTPLRDLDVPTTRFGMFSSDLTITNTTTGSLTFTGSVTSDAGLAVTLAPPSITIAPGATSSVTVTRQVDHDVVASGVEVHATITFSTAAGDVKVGLQVGVRDRIASAPSSVDLGLDLASLTTWTGQTTVQITNLRTDAAQTYAAAIACCDSVAQSGGTAVVASLDRASVTLAPGASTPVVVTVTASNATLASGRYRGSITLTSPMGSLTIPVAFFKGYGVRIDSPTTPAALAVSSASSGSKTLTPTASSTTLYTTTPGPFYVEAAWPFGNGWKHALAVASSTVGIATASLDPAQAVYRFDIQPRNEAGQPFADTFSMIYRFTHSASGGGIRRSIGVGGQYGSPIYVSAIPAGINFTAATAGVSPDPVAYVYELQGPISSNQVFTNSGADVITKEVRLFQPGAGTHPLVFAPIGCIPYFPWTSSPPGTAPIIASDCVLSGGVTWPAGVGRMLFYNSSNRDLLAAPYPDAPSASYGLYDGSIYGTWLGAGPNLWVSATNPLTWVSPSPWYGTVRLDEVYARSKCDEPPGNTLPVGPGPLQDEWAWFNHRTSGFFGGFKGYRQNPFIWGGCLQDYDFTTSPVSYRLYQDGALVASATMGGNTQLLPALLDGQYRFEMTRSPAIEGVATTSETVSTFEVSSGMSIDENPPAIHSLHLVGRGLWQQVLDPAVIDRIRFSVDPIPGNGDANPNGPPPPYLQLPDDLAQLNVSQSADGVVWRNVPTMALGNGEYLTDTLDVDPAVPLTWFRIYAADLAGNTLRTTFQVPRGTGYAQSGTDVTPPSTSITSPAAGAVLTGNALVSAVASDDVGVTRVDLLLDGTTVGTATAAPYMFSLNTSLVQTGSHVLRTRAQDAAENVGLSAGVPVTLQNSDTTPPVVSFASPAAGALVNGTVQITVNASDNAQVTRVEIYDGTTLLGAPTTPPYLASWPTAAAPDGTHTLRAVAFDPAGNSATATRAVTVDNTPPAVTWTGPADNSSVIGTVTLSAAVSDSSGVARVEFWYEDYSILTTVTTPPYSMQLFSQPYVGVHHFRARAYDTAGNQGQSALITLTIIEDLNPPVVTITTPVDGAAIGASTIVRVDAVDEHSITYIEVLDATTSVGYCLGAPPCIFTLSTTNLPDGPYTLTAQAADESFNLGTSVPVHVTIDKVLPTVSLTAPNNGATVSGTVTVSATASDNLAVARVELYDGTTLIAAPTSPPYSAAWNTNGVPAGQHTLKARAYDTAGNVKDSATRTVTVGADTVAPTVSITAPANNAVITGTVTWSATASDNVGVTRVELRDGSTVVTTLTASPYTFNWNTTPVSTGTHTLTARAFDAAGHSTTSAAVTVTVDRTAPTVALTAPASGATVSGTVTVSATASDNRGVARVEFYRDSTILLGTDTTSPYSISWNTITTPAGSHTLKAIAYDLAGNTTTSTSRTLTVRDVTAPTVSITSPANGARVKVGATVTIAATAADATGVTKVEFTVNGALTCTDTTAPYTCAWRVPSGANRSYALVAKAYDAANNSRSSTTVTVTSQ